MLPIPSINFVPKIYRDNVTTGVTQLTDELDDQIEAWRDSILNLGNLKKTMQCPEKFLIELGELFAAGLLQNDSELAKREKIAGAIASHKIRGSWTEHAKLILDATTGYSASIFRAMDSDDWICTGDGVIEAGTDWAILEGGVTDPYGMGLIGLGSEIEIAGNIYIDCHTGVFTGVLTADQIAKMVSDIATDIVPAYMRIYLGYGNVTGGFTVYAGGTIG